MRRWLFLGSGGLLVLVGLLLFLLTRVEVSAAISSYIAIVGLLVMGLALLAYYADSHVLVALIPGSLLTGLAVGILLGVLIGGFGALFVLGGLGVGFLAVALVDDRVAGRRQTWAIIPGAVLVGLGALLALAGGREDGQALGILSGVILVVLGVWVVVRQSRSAKKV
jgi:hypothetical protein